MSDYAQLESPKIVSSRVHPTSSTQQHHNSNKHDDDEKSFRSFSSKFSRASRKSLQNGELGTSLMASQDDDESSSCDRDDSFSSTTNNLAAAASPSVTSPSRSSPSKYELSQDDPFYMFRGDLIKKLLLVEGQLEKYVEIVQTTDTATNTHEIKETKKLLKRHMKAAESTLSDLETTIRVVERNRSKFPHISDVEITNRRGFVSDSQVRIQKCRDEMQSNGLKDKLLRDEQAKTARRKALSNNSNGINRTTRLSPHDDDNDLYLQEEGQSSRSETRLMMKEQDSTLDGLASAVTRVSHMAGTIHEEIETQNKMLTDLEDDLVDAEEQLGAVMGKLGKLLKTRNRCQIGLILVLSLIVLILFFLVLYT
eukprot:scaffold7825_cov67-Cyclotella_meneghiniana.AAC.4